MIDMRAEDESILQPHTRARHELMHNQYNKMKEEDDHWQDASVWVSSSSLVWPSFGLLLEIHLNFFFLCDAFPEIRTWPGGKTGGGAFLRISSKKRRSGR